ncbi:MAG: extracellular solute-binding protein, partial [Nakamurella sp.]
MQRRIGRSRRGLYGAWAVTLAAALAVAGCSSSDNGGAATSGTSAAASSAAASSAAGGTAPAATNTAGQSPNATPTNASLTIATNGISGGKNALEADWITNYVIPEFAKAQAAKGVTVTATYQPSGVDDEQYKSKLALDLKAGSGPDIMSIDGIWVGEFAQAGYIKPLSDVVGPSYENWDGWAQIKEPVQGNVSFQDQRYGIPAGTDGRVIFFNKKLFEQAGL